MENSKVKVNGKEAKLIKEGAVISERMKKDRLRLDAIKSELGYDDVNTYYTKDGNTLNITEKKNYLPINPKSAFDVLKKEGKSSHFNECVTVVVKELERFIPSDEVAKLRIEGIPTRAWSFR